MESAVATSCVETSSHHAVSRRALDAGALTGAARDPLNRSSHLTRPEAGGRLHPAFRTSVFKMAFASLDLAGPAPIHSFCDLGDAASAGVFYGACSIAVLGQRFSPVGGIPGV